MVAVILAVLIIVISIVFTFLEIKKFRFSILFSGIGFALIIISLFFLKWVSVSSSSVFQENIDNLISSETSIAEFIKNLPGFNKSGTDYQITSEQIVSYLSDNGKNRVVDFVINDKPINGFRITQIFFVNQSVFSVSIIAAAICSLLLFVLSFHRYISKVSYFSNFKKFLLLIIFFSTLILIANITELDTFGEFNFRNRIVSAFIELDYAAGCWVFIIGQLFSFVSIVPEWLAASTECPGDE